MTLVAAPPPTERGYRHLLWHLNREGAVWRWPCGSEWQWLVAALRISGTSASVYSLSLDAPGADIPGDDGLDASTLSDVKLCLAGTVEA